MDSFDREILKALQTNARISTEELGFQVGLSASACQRRIKKLKATGVIAKEVVILDKEKLAGHLTVIVDVSLEKGGEKSLNKFISLMHREQQVQQLHYVAGETDFVVIISAQSMDDFDKLSRRIFLPNNNIKKFSSKVVIKSHKVGMEIPL